MLENRLRWTPKLLVHSRRKISLASESNFKTIPTWSIPNGYTKVILTVFWLCVSADNLGPASIATEQDDVKGVCQVEKLLHRDLIWPPKLEQSRCLNVLLEAHWVFDMHVELCRPVTQFLLTSEVFRASEKEIPVAVFYVDAEGLCLQV